MTRRYRWSDPSDVTELDIPRLRDAVIVTTGSYPYRRPGGIAIVPAALLGR